MNFIKNYFLLGLIFLGLFIGIFLQNEAFAQAPKFAPTVLEENFKIQVIQQGLDFPTKMTFVDDETIFIAQKANGQIAWIRNFEMLQDPVLDLNVESGWERGFVGLESAKTDEKTYVFVYYTESVTDGDTYVAGDKKEGNQNNGDKLVRYTWDGDSLKDPQEILHPISYANKMHSGGATTILDDYIYLIVGDNNEHNEESENPGNLLLNTSNEKNFLDRAVIFKIDFEGNPSPDGPFYGTDLEKYYSYGIRNGYGLAVDPVTKQIWDTENGPELYDEINLIYPGFNSGWKKIQGPNKQGNYFIAQLTFLIDKINLVIPGVSDTWEKIIGPQWPGNYMYTEISKLPQVQGAKYSDPEFSWGPAIGVTAIEFINSDKYGSDYKNDVLVGDVHGRLYHFELNTNRDGFKYSDPTLEDNLAYEPGEDQSLIFAENLGIITDIKTGPDGYLYVVSMVHADSPGWGKWASNLNRDLEKQGAGLGVLFRLIPESLFNETYQGLSPQRQIELGNIPTTVICEKGYELNFTSSNIPNCIESNLLD